MKRLTDEQVRDLKGLYGATRCSTAAKYSLTDGYYGYDGPLEDLEDYEWNDFEARYLLIFEQPPEEDLYEQMKEHYLENGDKAYGGALGVTGEHFEVSYGADLEYALVEPFESDDSFDEFREKYLQEEVFFDWWWSTGLNTESIEYIDKLPTSCRLVYDTQDQEFGLSLRGAGMDLNETVALAFIEMGMFPPYELAMTLLRDSNYPCFREKQWWTIEAYCRHTAMTLIERCQKALQRAEEKYERLNQEAV